MENFVTNADRGSFDESFLLFLLLLVDILWNKVSHFIAYFVFIGSCHEGRTSEEDEGCPTDTPSIK